MDSRLQNEINQGRKISADAQATWGWAGVAGEKRWARRVEMLLAEVAPQDAVLEIGCGVGLLTGEAAQRVRNLFALDVSPDLLIEAKKEANTQDVNLVCGNAYELCFPDNTFDRIIGMSVLHHLEIDKALEEMHRVVKKGGRVIFSEPNMLNPQIFLERNFFREYFHNTPDETAFIRWSLKRKLREFGFQDITIYPFDFLHPATPAKWVKVVDSIAKILEKIFPVSEIAGSLYIEAVKR